MGGNDSDDTGILGGLALRGARAYLTGQNARELFDAVDVGTLIEGGAVDEAIEREQIGRLAGRLLGRTIAEELAEGSRLRAFVVGIAGQRVGAKLGEAATVALLDHGLLASVIDDLRSRTTDDALVSLLDEIEVAIAPDTETGTETPADAPGDGTTGSVDLSANNVASGEFGSTSGSDGRDSVRGDSEFRP